MKTLVLILMALGFSGRADVNIAADHAIIYKKELKWMPAPSALPKGAEVAVLHGDPSKAEEFTMRLKIPANFTIAPHHHPGEEHLTVLEGTLFFGAGEKLDQRVVKSLEVGDFVIMKPGTKHFVMSKGSPVIIQIHGIGPWGITYVNAQ